MPFSESKLYPLFFSPLLYVSFWSMSMYDLYCPVERYKIEVGKLKTSMQEVDDNKEIVRAIMDKLFFYLLVKG